MKLIFFVIILLVITILACWLVKKLVEYIINLWSLRRQDCTHSAPYFREGGGIAYNKKTNKLEANGGKNVLPFEWVTLGYVIKATVYKLSLFCMFQSCFVASSFACPCGNFFLLSLSVIIRLKKAEKNPIKMPIWNIE